MLNVNFCRLICMRSVWNYVGIFNMVLKKDYNLMVIYVIVEDML